MIQSITNFFEYNPNLLAGGQPSENHLNALKEHGIEAVVNISPLSAKNALKSEGEIVEALNMDYIHFPVDCSNLRPIHFNTFDAILSSLKDKKVFVHCGGNIKTSNLIYMYQVKNSLLKKEEALKILKSIQTPEEKWYTYFTQFGI